MSRFGITCLKTAEECVYKTDDLRFSVLSDRILRIEKSPSGNFTDLPSQTVFCRNFAKPDFNVQKNGDKVRIMTKSVVFVVDTKTLACECEADGKRLSVKGNLKGTARTLDMTNGYVKIGQGIMSRGGMAVYDDSKSCLLDADGALVPREKGSRDVYVFAFGHDYRGGLKEFFALTGYPPVLPKYALGNWWSRYHAYTEDEYVSLMDKFAEKKVPLTVATVDMDWHIVDDVPSEFRSRNPFQCAGWTGYTFDKKLFPDYKRFFKSLKDRGLAITLNLHPRDGVRYYEEQYPEMARACGIDPATKKTVEFDLTDKKFRDAYFDILHHPYEDAGVDFWWIDWQQGTKSAMKGVDPLWLLNHYHFADAGREGRTALILSRYAGVGSHRYPLGFSGDTVVSWKSLKLQPRFTATAANVGYTWWSHDIGGHMFGKGDGELYLRWLQFGVFSPVNRLHSTKNGLSKEPWLYGDTVEPIAEDFMRLRHRLLPYLYTANIRTAKFGEPIVAPMYYGYDEPFAYDAKNQYIFGGELLVAPVVKRAGKDGMSVTKVWFPAGKWTNFFTGEVYEGEKLAFVKSALDEFPVYAKEGAIIPFIAEREGNSVKFDEIEVRVFKGNGEYTMYDEKGSISFKVSTEGKVSTLEILPSEDCGTRKIKVAFYGGECNGVRSGKEVVTGCASVVVPCKACEVSAEWK